MQFRENLVRLRKERGWSQEELGYRLDVSRQTVSKWESGATAPEMGKLICMSELFGTSIDELVSGEQKAAARETHGIADLWSYEYTSRTRLNGIPLVHINCGRGFRKAKGIIAIGNLAVGVVAIGGVSAGIISFGAVSVGLLACAAAAVGLLSVGALAIGLAALGGICTGYLAVGGIARGVYTIGGMSIARNVALGGYARGYIAVGEQVKGVLTFLSGENFAQIDQEQVLEVIHRTFPETPSTINKIFNAILQ